jgi:hypothetical protein
LPFLIFAPTVFSAVAASAPLSCSNPLMLAGCTFGGAPCQPSSMSSATTFFGFCKSSLSRASRM